MTTKLKCDQCKKFVDKDKIMVSGQFNEFLKIDQFTLTCKDCLDGQDD